MEFLKFHGVYDEYLKLFSERPLHSYSLEIFVREIDPENWLYNAFTWNASKTVRNWNELSNLWEFTLTIQTSDNFVLATRLLEEINSQKKVKKNEEAIDSNYI